jgi:hypothetical protein
VPSPNDFDFDQPEKPAAPREAYHAEFDEDAASSGKPPRPHRGGLILTLGIFSIFFGLIATALSPLGFFCSALPFFTAWSAGLLALSMSGSDLLRMAQGGIDRSGRGLTKAGRICGIVGLVITTLGFLVLLFLVLVAANQ